MIRPSVVSAFSAITLLAGCSGGEADPPSDDGPTYHRDIAPLVQVKCAGCHADGGIAPFPLTTHDEVASMKGAIAAAVSARTMPPWPAGEGCSDYLGDRSLTDDQIDLMARWVEAGAPAGDPGVAPVPVEDRSLRLSRVDFELPMPEPYTPKTSPDEYRCFFVDWPAAETSYVTGFGVEPGVPAIVHHVIAYVARPDQIDKYQALDDADPGAGWSCFGGPGGESVGSAPWLGAWVPGATGADFPEGTGIEILAGSRLIVQMHYNTLSAPPSADRTKVLVRTDAAVEKKAAVLPFTNVSWVLSQTMHIPAHSTDTTHSYKVDPTLYAGLATGGALPSGVPLAFHATGLHMHTLGTRASTRIDRADGTSECMLEIPRWNFHWQGQYLLAAPKRVAPGDKVHLECHWDNPGSLDVNWGEGTGDEMCLAVFYATE